MNFEGCLVKPKPLIGSTENPVMIHDVIVSGTFLVIVIFVVLKMLTFVAEIIFFSKNITYFESKFKLSKIHVSGNVFLISIGFGIAAGALSCAVLRFTESPANPACVDGGPAKPEARRSVSPLSGPSK